MKIPHDDDHYRPEPTIAYAVGILLLYGIVLGCYFFWHWVHS
jgi:hypothetical protein